MLSVGNINFRDYYRQSEDGKSKQKSLQKYSSNMTFGMNLSPAQKGEALGKFFAMPVDDVLQRVHSAVDVLPANDSNTIAKKTADFMRNLYEDLGAKKGSIFDSIANALNISPNDPERMFVDGQFKSIIGSVERRNEYEPFMDKLFGGLYTKEVELPVAEQSIMQNAVAAKSNVTSPVASKPKQSVESLLRSQEQSEAAKNEPANVLKVGRKAKRAAKLQQLKDTDAAVTVRKIGALKLAVQEIGHEIISYQNELEKVNSEIKRLGKLKASKTSKSKAYKDEIQRAKYEALISSKEGRIKEIDAQTAAKRLENLDVNSAVHSDKRVERRYNRYLGILKTDKDAQDETSLKALKEEYELFNEQNPSVAMLTEKIDKYKKFLNFDEYYQKELARINQSVVLSAETKIKIQGLNSQIFKLENENKPLLYTVQVLEKVDGNPKYVKIDYEKKLATLEAEKPQQSSFDTPQGFNNARKNWNLKLAQVQADKILAVKYQNNQKTIVELTAQAQELEKLKELTPAAKVELEELELQKKNVEKHLNQSEMQKLETQRAQLVKELQPIFELQASISKWTNNKQNLLDKIYSAEKRQLDAMHEQTILEKMVGQGAIKNAKDAEVAKAAQAAKGANAGGIKNPLAEVVDSVREKIFTKFTKPVVEQTGTIVEDGLTRNERKLINKERKAEAKAMGDSMSYGKGKKVAKGKAKNQNDVKNLKEKTGFKTIDVELSPQDKHDLEVINSRLGQIDSKEGEKRTKYNKLFFELSGGSMDMFGNTAQLKADMEELRGLSSEDGTQYFDLLKELRTKYQVLDDQLGLYDKRNFLEDELPNASDARKKVIEKVLENLNKQIAEKEPKRDEIFEELKAMGAEKTDLRQSKLEIEARSKKIVRAK